MTVLDRLRELTEAATVDGKIIELAESIELSMSPDQRADMWKAQDALLDLSHLLLPAMEALAAARATPHKGEGFEIVSLDSASKMRTVLRQLEEALG